MSKKSSSFSWSERVSSLTQDLIKKSKGSRPALLILSSSGDLIWQAGATKSIDSTTLGALVTAARGVTRELDQLTKCKTERVTFGEAQKAYWMENLKDWIIVGIRFEPQKKIYEELKKHLKKKPRSSTKHASEALDGLSHQAVESAIEG